jgi:hypothetical protein
MAGLGLFPMLNLEQAAAVLGCSESGLRKIVRRREIHFFQARKHSPLKFKPEWLAEYIDRHDTPPDESSEAPAARQRQPRPAPPVANRFGL